MDDTKQPGPTVDAETRRVVYQVASQLWNTSEQVRWSVLYNYLMASTILLLAWATMFGSNAPGRARPLILLLLAAGGALLSGIWAAFLLRDTFVDRFEQVALRAERDLGVLDGPVTANISHRESLTGVYRLATSRRVATLVASLFTAIYLALTCLSASWVWRALGAP